MKFTCLQENLVRGLAVVGKAVATKGSLPVLSNVLIASDNGRIKLSATNLETAITTWIGASIDEEGSITVPERVLYEFVSNLPPSNVVGEVEGNALKLSSDRASSKFNGLDPSEFPSLPYEEGDIHLKIDPRVFSEAVLETAFAAAVDESRPVLTGILLSAGKDGLLMVGVDGFRLAERVIRVGEETIKKKFSAIVPSKVLLEIGRLSQSLKEPLEVSLNKDGNLMLFKSGDILISSRVIDGEFPDYKKLIPDRETTPIKVRISTKDLVNALRLANVFAKDSVSVVRLKISPDDGAIFVISSNSEVGENASRIEAAIDGGELEVAFNSRYLMDALSNVKTDEFLFECSDRIGPGMPGVLRPSNRDNHTYLIMPLQI